jgi:uncharacterized membrane protein
MEPRVDRTALRVNQASIILLSLIGFVLGTEGGRWLIALVALVLALGTILPGAALFKLIYARVLKPRGLLRPDVIADDPRAHRFAQGVGAAFLGAGAIALFAGWNALGWTLVWIVVALAAINLLFGFCAGCFVYYQLGRRGLLRSEARQ